MLSRLWWKEWRMFWPIGLVVALAAAGLQWLFLQSLWEGARNGALTPMALGWAALYACAVGASAFAGERETATLAFLDILPVSRRTLWAGKATFGLLTTAALAMVLLAMADLSTLKRDAGLELETVLIGYGTLVLETLCWSMFWSALSSNALIAATLGLCSVGAVFAMTISDGEMAGVPGLDRTAPLRALVALAMLGLSRVVIAWPLRPRGGAGGVRGPKLARVHGKPPVAPSRARLVASSIVEVATMPVLDLSWIGRTFRMIRSLVWETVREARPTWLLLFGICAGVPHVFYRLGTLDPLDELTLGLGALACGVAGLCVFGIENRERSYRTYVHHGVRPGLVWLVKEGVWIVGLAALGGLVLMLRAFEGAPGPASEVPALIVVPVYGFAVGQLCGMLIRRGITAGLVSLLSLVILVAPQLGLASTKMLPPWSLWLTPAILLMITGIWIGEWMLERSGAGRWVRLGLLLTVPFGALVASYAAFRAWSVPEIGRPFDLADVRSPVIPAGENAARLYREAVAKMLDPRKNAEALALIREASSMPRARFQWVELMHTFSPVDSTVSKAADLARLVDADARARLSGGDLAGAWDDIRVMFRMAGQFADPPSPQGQRLAAANVQSQAIAQGMSWAGDPRQTPASLRSALADVRRLPPLAPVEKTIEVEGELFERALGLPSEELLEPLASRQSGETSPLLGRILLSLTTVTPWERERAERIGRHAIAEYLRSSFANFVSEEDPIRSLFESPYRTPLAEMVFPRLSSLFASDLGQIARVRALEQILALRIWQLEHGGKYPEKLEELVPSVLDRLPLDPYSGQPFGHGQFEVEPQGPPNPLGPEMAGMMSVREMGTTDQSKPTRRRTWFLYSVERLGRHDATMSHLIPHPSARGLMFELPAEDRW